MSDDSAYRKILRLIERGRDSPNSNEEPEDEYGSVPKRLRGELERKDEYLIRNGTWLFRELVKSSHGKNNHPFRIFSLKELQKATNNFSADQSWNSTYSHSLTYRGTIEGKRVVVKISGVNEVVCLSLIKHRNVVKLLGCCLETFFPIVVHELPPNGTLEQNIFYEEPPPVELSWTDRLRIATEITDVLAYLHSELHMTHGHLSHPLAILLDEFHSAKLGAFHRSKIQNQTKSSNVETDIRNNLSRKLFDACTYGNILLNLLDIHFREVHKCYDDKEEILKYLKLNVSEKEMPQIEAYIDLFLRCPSSYKVDDGEDKVPSMEEVVRELRCIRSMINHQPTTYGNDSHNLSSGAN